MFINLVLSPFTTLHDLALNSTKLNSQFFYIRTSSQTSYNTLKVYLAAIWLQYLEQQFSDLTSNEMYFTWCAEALENYKVMVTAFSLLPLIYCVHWWPNLLNILCIPPWNNFTMGCLPIGFLWFYNGYWIYTTFIFKQFLITSSPMVWS